MELVIGFIVLGSDLNPLEEHEFEFEFGFSLRKSFNILGLLSMVLNLLCCTSIFKKKCLVLFL